MCKYLIINILRLCGFASPSRSRFGGARREPLIQLIDNHNLKILTDPLKIRKLEPAFTSLRTGKNVKMLARPKLWRRRWSVRVK